MSITFVLGGARSGKSSYAQRAAEAAAKAGGVQPVMIVTAEAGDAEILYDDAVRLQLVEDGKLLDGSWNLLVADERVERDIDLLAALGASAGEKVAQLVGGEVHGFCACGEGVKAEIDGVGAGREGGAGDVERAGWC